MKVYAEELMICLKHPNGMVPLLFRQLLLIPQEFAAKLRNALPNKTALGGQGVTKIQSEPSAICFVFYTIESRITYELTATKPVMKKTVTIAWVIYLGIISRVVENSVTKKSKMSALDHHINAMKIYKPMCNLYILLTVIANIQKVLKKFHIPKSILMNRKMQMVERF